MVWSPPELVTAPPPPCWPEDPAEGAGSRVNIGAGALASCTMKISAVTLRAWSAWSGGSCWIEVPRRKSFARSFKVSLGVFAEW